MATSHKQDNQIMKLLTQIWLNIYMIFIIFVSFSMLFDVVNYEKYHNRFS